MSSMIKNLNHIKIKGGSKIEGTIKCGGAKNLASKVIIASIMCRSKIKILNAPEILDMISVINMCKQIGVDCESSNNQIIVDSREICSGEISEDKVLGVGSRLSHLFIGSLIHFLPSVSAPMPSGCQLGNRSIDFHLDILKKFGLKVILENDFLKVSKSSNQKIRACSINLPYPSVGATEMSIFLSVLAEGRSVISGIAIEPEISSLISFLQRCGAIIRYIGDRKISIEGVESLSGSDFFVFGDRLEAAGWACLACASGGKIKVEGIQFENLSNFLGPFMLIGGGFEVIDQDSILFFRKKERLESVFLETGPFPMFSTDYQPMFSILMTLANGNSIIHETLFSNRLGYLDNLAKFGVKFNLDDHCYGNECRFAHLNSNHSAIITGVDHFISPSEPIESDTLRSGFAYLMAAIIANGETEIRNIEHVMRGYSNLREKLIKIGVQLISDSENTRVAYK